MPRLDDLTGPLRKAAIDAIARDELARVTRRPPAVSTMPARGRGGRGTLTCHQCGQQFGAYAPSERHMDEQHSPGGRLEWSEGAE